MCAVRVHQLLHTLELYTIVAMPWIGRLKLFEHRGGGVSTVGSGIHAAN